MGGFGSENGKDLQFFRQWDCFNRAIRKYLPVGKNQAQPTRPVGRICDLSSFDRSQPTPKTPQTPNRISPPKWDNEPRSRPATPCNVTFSDAIHKNPVLHNEWAKGLKSGNIRGFKHRNPISPHVGNFDNRPRSTHPPRVVASTFGPKLPPCLQLSRQHRQKEKMVKNGCIGHEGPRR